VVVDNVPAEYADICSIWLENDDGDILVFDVELNNIPDIDSRYHYQLSYSGPVSNTDTSPFYLMA